MGCADPPSKGVSRVSPSVSLELTKNEVVGGESSLATTLLSVACDATDTTCAIKKRQDLWGGSR